MKSIKEVTLYKIITSIAVVIAMISIATTMTKADSEPILTEAKDVVVNVYCNACCSSGGGSVAKPVSNTNTNTNTNTIIINNNALPEPVVIIDKSKVHIHNNIHPKTDIKVNNHNKK